MRGRGSEDVNHAEREGGRQGDGVRVGERGREEEINYGFNYCLE